MGTPYQNRSKCPKCNMRAWTLKYPLKAAYSEKRKNAKRDRIEFKLTLEQFKTFCDDTGYLKKKGTGPDDMVMGRKDHYIGYQEGNIKMLTRRENSREGKTGKRPEYRPKDVPF